MRIRELTVSQLVSFLECHVKAVFGSTDAVINNLCDASHANNMTLDWIDSCRDDKQRKAEESLARVILTDSDVVYSGRLKDGGKTLIVVDNPKMAIAIVGNEFFGDQPSRTVHSTSVIDPECEIAANVSIGPFTHIGRAKIGAGTSIGTGVRIYDDVVIGERCVINDGAVIGGAGFGFMKEDDGNWFRFPQIGDVVIGNCVEIGANTCVDRGALSTTSIGDHTKINNLCHIAHNNTIGRNVIIAAQVNLSGGNTIGDDCWIAPSASLRGYIHVGAGSTIGLGAVVIKDIPSGEIWAGNPAHKLR